MGAALTVVLLKALLLFQVRVTDGSLRPALVEGDRLLVMRLWGDNLPRKGDVVVYRDPLPMGGGLCLARCLSLPGDTLWIHMDTPAADSADAPKVRAWRSVVVPRRGEPVEVKPWNKSLLANALRLHEGANVCEGPDGEALVVDGQLMRQIPFTRDYLWLAADGRQGRGYDSRMYGFLPVDYVIGRGVRVSYSKALGTPLWTGWRADRVWLSATAGR